MIPPAILPALLWLFRGFGRTEESLGTGRVVVLNPEVLGGDVERLGDVTGTGTFINPPDPETAEVVEEELLLDVDTVALEELALVSDERGLELSVTGELLTVTLPVAEVVVMMKEGEDVGADTAPDDAEVDG